MTADRDRISSEGCDSEAAKPPRTFRALRDLIVARRDKLPRRLAQVAAYVMELPDEIAFGTVGSVAEAADVQPSTLVRFAKAFGYNGFSDFQVVFRERLRSSLSNYDERLAALEDHFSARFVSLAMLDGFCNAATDSITRANEKMSAAALEQAAQILTDADTIYIIGQNRAYAIASYVAYILANLGVRNVLIGAPPGPDREVLRLASPADAILAISFTPYASKTAEYVQQASAQGVPVVAITDSPFSPLAHKGDVWLEVVDTDFEGFRSIAATLTVATALTVSVGNLRRRVEKQNINSNFVEASGYGAPVFSMKLPNDDRITPKLADNISFLPSGDGERGMEEGGQSRRILSSKSQS